MKNNDKAKYRHNLYDILFPLTQWRGTGRDKIYFVKKYEREYAIQHEHEALVSEAEHSKVDELQKAKIFKGIKRRLTISKVKIALITLIGILIILAGILTFLNKSITQVQYEDNISVTLQNNDLIAFLDGMAYNSAKSKLVEININGEIKNSLYFSLSSSLMQKFFMNDSVIQSKYVLAYDYIDEGVEGGASQIDNIYYFIGDYTHLEILSEKELEKRTKDAVLLWTREI